MTRRPEFIVCVADSHRSNHGKTWCGIHVLDAPGETFFRDVDHAALHRRNGDRLLVCPKCLAAITVALNSGQAEIKDRWKP